MNIPQKIFKDGFHRLNLYMKSFFTLFVVAQIPLATAQNRSSSPASPSRECECRQYESIAHLTDFSDQILAVGARAFNPSSGANFAEMRRQLLQQIPQRCRQYIFDRLPIPDVTLSTGFALMDVTNDARDAPAYQATSQRITNAVQASYLNYISANSPNGPCTMPMNLNNSASQNDPAARAYYDCMESHGGELFTNYSNFVGGDANHLASLSPEASNDPSLGRMLRAYLDLINSGDQWRSALHRHDDLNTDERLAVVTAVLGRMNNVDYNLHRAEMTVTAQGALDAGALLAATRHNTAIGYFNDFGGGYRPESTYNGGVCRDAAILAASLLSEWNFPHTFVVTGSTRQGDWHTWVTTGDPRNPSTTYTFNTSIARRTQNTVAEGSQAITIPMSSSGLHRIFFSNGAPATTIELPRNLARRQMMGIDPIDPMSNLPQPLAMGAVSLNRNGTTEIRPAFVRDTANAYHFGVALTHDYGQTTFAPGRIGVLVEGEVPPDAPLPASVSPFPQMAPQGSDGSASPGGSTNGAPQFVPMSLVTLFAYMEQHFNSPELTLFRGALRARIESLASIAFNAMMSLGPAGNGDLQGPLFSFDGDARIQAGLRVDHGNRWRDSFSATLRALAQVEPSLRDVRNVSFAQMPIPLLHHLLVDGQIIHRLYSTPAGRAFLLAAGRVVVDMLGVRGRAELGINFGPVAISTYFQGRLAGDVPLWMPGAARTVGGTLQVRPPSLPVQLSVSASANIEPGTPVTGGVQGNLTWILETNRRQARPANANRQAPAGSQ